jgi:NAD(P)-dependent dehydrogenase (short-subunit alcohol dehydrogenase family)
MVEGDTKTCIVYLNSGLLCVDERGIIITTTSISALDGTMVGYGTAKSGVAGLTLPLAKELAPHGIRVMSIAPGPFGKRRKKDPF